MVPSSSGLRTASVYYYSCCFALCQVSVLQSPALKIVHSLITSQLLSCREKPDSSPVSSSDPFHRSWWYNRPHNANMHDVNVYDLAPSYPAAVLRNILVYAPFVHSVFPCSLYPCHWLLRTGYNKPYFTICGTRILESLHRL